MCISVYQNRAPDPPELELQSIASCHSRAEHWTNLGPMREQQVFWTTESLLQAPVVCQTFSWGDGTHTALLTPDREPMADHSAFLWSLQKCLFKPFFQFYFVLVIEPSACLANTLPLTYVLRWLLLMSVCVRLVLRQGGLLLRSSACTYPYAQALLVFYLGCLFVIECWELFTCSM